jgi:hypothetical protein
LRTFNGSLSFLFSSSFCKSVNSEFFALDFIGFVIIVHLIIFLFV